MTEPNENPLSYQVGGDHYKDLEYQPIEFFEDLHLDAFRANIIKYLARWRKKGGVEDLKKALHYAQIWRQNWDKQIRKMTIFANQLPGPENEIIIKVVAGNPPSVVADIEHMILEYEEAQK